MSTPRSLPASRLRSAIAAAGLALILLASDATAATRDPMAVLWDISHSPLCTEEGCYRPADLYLVLRGWLEETGFHVDEWTAGVTNADLDHYGVVVIAELSSWGAAYGIPETSALQKYVDNGGGLLVMLESQNTPWRCDEVQPVSRLFGVTCTGAGMDYGGWTENLSDHPVYDGVDHMAIDLASALRVQPPSVTIGRFVPGIAVPLVTAAELTQNREPGRVIVIADSQVWDNYMAADPDHQHPATRRWAENTFCWLSNGCGPAPVLIGVPPTIECVALGTPISFEVSAYDPDGGVVTLSMTQGPAGASFPGASGVGTVSSSFDWIPTSLAGDRVPIDFEARDTDSPLRIAGARTYVTVVATPVFLASPASTTICPGDAPVVSVTADPDVYDLDWQQSTDGSNWFSVGVTSDVWQMPPQTESSWVRCHAHLGCGQIDSAPAAITVLGPPGAVGDTLRAALAAGTVHLSWSPASGATSYVVRGCDASTGPCSPAPITTVGSTSADVPTGRETLVWWTVEAVDDCGSSP